MAHPDQDTTFFFCRHSQDFSATITTDVPETAAVPPAPAVGVEESPDTTRQCSLWKRGRSWR